MIREADEKDLNGLLELYLHLHETSVPEIDEKLKNTWNKILGNSDYHLIVAEEDGRIVSSCTCIVVPNLTRGGLPYALVENVVTHIDYRGRHLASACLEYARKIAEENECYKIMLITGSHDPKTHDFYRNAGYSSDGKTAYYCMLKEVNWKV
ncbi:MAG: GNAT family N-acetyltransferase [Oscillospiraceae bacterium]|nr:GNAT family N-acetyltransferase [Oscillospiraceae bacterium]